jgi:hypothetical protein
VSFHESETVPPLHFLVFDSVFPHFQVLVKTGPSGDWYLNLNEMNICVSSAAGVSSFWAVKDEKSKNVGCLIKRNNQGKFWKMDATELAC